MIIQGMDIVMIIMLMLGEVIRGQISVANLGLWLLKRFKCLKSILFSVTNWEFMGTFNFVNGKTVVEVFCGEVFLSIELTLSGFKNTVKSFPHEHFYMLL